MVTGQEGSEDKTNSTLHLRRLEGGLQGEGFKGASRGLQALLKGASRGLEGGFTFVKPSRA